MRIRSYLQKLLIYLENSQIKRGKKEVYHGIILCDINLDESDDEKFFKITKEAIDLIAKIDQRRFKRVKSELKYILNQELLSIGVYRKRLRACGIDFGEYEFDENYKWYLYSYAGTIVHEATHGYLDTKKYKYTSKNRVQIEKICRTEQNRFLKKLDYELKDQLIRKFNEKDWDFYWHASKWDQLKAILQRLRKSSKKNKDFRKSTN